MARSENLAEQLPIPGYGPRPIRASELSSYLYCARAWWYRQKGHLPENEGSLAAGTLSHDRHGRDVFASGCQRILAYALLLIALVLITAYFTRALL